MNTQRRGNRRNSPVNARRSGIFWSLLLALGLGVACVQAQTNGSVVGWNNLGMHCMDADFSVFCILPPYNVIFAQTIDSSGLLVGGDTGSTVTYQAVADPSGSINTTSSGKNNFWQYVNQLFGIALKPDVGLPVPGPNSFAMPGVNNTPQAMAYDTTAAWFAGYGVPMTPYDDAGRTNRYPMMRLVAKNGSTLAAHKDIVLPVAEEMNCKACHGSGTGTAAQPADGWVNLADRERDYRLNILRVHDDRQLGTPTFTAALAAGGYASAGLYASVVADGKPVLCAACHHSEALPGSGQTGVPPLTESIHTHHGAVVDPANGMLLDTEANRTSCYYCHPGQATRCLRGVMGTSVAVDGSLAIECQSCHGGMNVVGAATRTGWLNEPNCQACHSGDATSNSGQIRYTSVFQSANVMRMPSNTRFATSPDVPAASYSLYRFSRGHGGLYCEACHNSTHAEFPSADTNDNIACIQQQGHIGVLAECESCHGTTPSTVTGGPHGLHPMGQTWVSRHQDNAGAACQVCHGTDYRGTVLSRSRADRTLSAMGTKNFWRGYQIGCYTCHNGPGGDGTGPAPAVATSRTIATSVGASVAIPLTATSAAGSALTLRVVSQTAHGRVGLSGTVATYFPDPGFAGSDTFTFSAWNGSADSNLGTVTITVGQGTPCTYGISPASATVAAGAGKGTLGVNAGSGCAWTTVNAIPWVTISGGASGTGPGTVSYSYTANPGNASRSGTLTVAGLPFALTQAGLACTYSITPTSASAGGGAGTGSVAVNTSANCAWTASSAVPWLTVTSGATGTGPGTVAYAIAANTGAARLGTLTVAGLTYTVNQAGTACSYAIAPASAAVGAAAGSGSVTVSTTANCPWGAASSVPWLTVTSGTAGVGPGTVTYTIAANTGTGSRTGTLTIGGQTFTVTQSAATCTYAIAPASVSLGAHATNGAVAITTGYRCAWTASSTVPWITITSGANGTGNGTVVYEVMANTTGLTRHGSLSIAGLTFVVSQLSSGGGCTYLLTPASANVPATVSTNTFRVTTGGGCTWTAQSAVSWVTVLPRAGGTGSGSVQYRVSANLSTRPRNGTITVGGQTFTVYQAGSPGYQESSFGEVSVSGVAGHQRITAEFILQNNGETAKEKLHPSVYLSDSPVLKSGAVLLWGRTVPALAPGESVVGKFRLTVPGGDTHGKYLLADVSAGGPLKSASAATVVYGPLP